MNTQTSNPRRISLAAAALLLLASAGTGLATHPLHLVDGITGPNFNLVAAPGYLSTPEGNSLYFWGYGRTAAQYSGPTLIVNQGDVVTVTLNNKLPVPVSMVFPGQGTVSASGGSAGLLTRESAARTANAAALAIIGTTAQATANLAAGAVSSITIASGMGGAGYTAAPGVTITAAPGDPGSGAAATASIDASGVVTKITVTSAGSGYLVPPTVTIDAPSTLGTVVSIVVKDGGIYTTAPAVTITAAADDPGSGAAATASIDASGVVTAITVDNPGSGYLVAPTVTMAPLSGVVTYMFTASQPGTYMYHSGTQPDLQIEMGLVGALIVRPTGFSSADGVNPNRRAYGDPSSEFDHEYLFLLSDMDDKIHNAVELQVQAGTLPITVDMSTRFAVYWFINGRCGPDTMLPAAHSSLPVQPYDCFPLFRPGEKVLMRVIGGGSDEHPFHHHGNHARMIAQDGRLLQSPGGSGADLGNLEFTVPSTPGSTIDTMFSWTGKGLGWDAYGHKPGEPLAQGEDPDDHLKPFPVTLPAEQNIVNGMMYGGSPFLGSAGIQKPGEGGFNGNNGFMYLWHSHAEKEIVNNDIFPGGMLTFALVEAH